MGKFMFAITVSCGPCGIGTIDDQSQVRSYVLISHIIFRWGIAAAISGINIDAIQIGNSPVLEIEIEVAGNTGLISHQLTQSPGVLPLQ